MAMVSVNMSDNGGGSKKVSTNPNSSSGFTHSSGKFGSSTGVNTGSTSISGTGRVDSGPVKEIGPKPVVTTTITSSTGPKPVTDMGTGTALPKATGTTVQPAPGVVKPGASSGTTVSTGTPTPLPLNPNQPVTTTTLPGNPNSQGQVTNLPYTPNTSSTTATTGTNMKIKPTGTTVQPAPGVVKPGASSGTTNNGPVAVTDTGTRTSLPKATGTTVQSAPGVVKPGATQNMNDPVRITDTGTGTVSPKATGTTVQPAPGVVKPGASTGTTNNGPVAVTDSGTGTPSGIARHTPEKAESYIPTEKELGVVKPGASSGTTNNGPVAVTDTGTGTPSGIARHTPEKAESYIPTEEELGVVKPGASSGTTNNGPVAVTDTGTGTPGTYQTTPSDPGSSSGTGAGTGTTLTTPVVEPEAPEKPVVDEDGNNNGYTPGTGGGQGYTGGNGQIIHLSPEQIEHNIIVLKSASQEIRETWVSILQSEVTTLENSWIGQDAIAYTQRVRAFDKKVDAACEAIELLASTYQRASDQLRATQSNLINTIRTV